MDEKRDELILIDGNSLINRAYYGVPPLTTKSGMPVGAVYGFTNMLVKLLESHNPKYLAVAFDLKAKTFRHLTYDGYKANRHGMPDDLAAQVPVLKNLLAKMGIKILQKEGIEADDIIGTMSKRFNKKTYIVTGDRDSFQLIDESNTVLFTKRGISDVAEMTPASLLAEYELTPSQIIDYKALAGDSSDNIPGVPGIGDKTAVNLLKEYGSLSEIYNNIEKITGAVKTKLENGKESADLSYFLATIKTDCDFPCELSECEFPFPFSGDVFNEFINLEFKTLIKRPQLFSSTETAFLTKIDVKEIEISSEGSLSVALSSVKTLALDIGDRIVFSTDGVIQYYVPVAETMFDVCLDYDSIMAGLKPFLENPDIRKIVYDKKAVMHKLSPYGINLVNADDVALMNYLVKRNFKYSDASGLCENYSLDKNYSAAALYHECTSSLRELKENGMEKLYTELELPLETVLFEMEQSGFRIDEKLLSELGSKYDSEMNEILNEIYSLTGKTFNVNSPKQLAEVLFDDLKLPNPGGNSRSTAADILEKIKYAHPSVEKILRYRFISKLKSTYIDGLSKVVDKKGYVHTEFNQMLTSTGRLSSSNPNLQNIPVREEEGKALRGLFLPSEGNILVSADYSQIELRVMAHLSGDENLRRAYTEGKDIHSAVSEEIFGTSDPHHRRMAKVVNFGIIYGMSAFGLSEDLGITPNEAKNYIEKYFERYPLVKAYTRSAVEDARRKGYSESILGRRRVIQELFSPKFTERSFGERAAMNMPLQSSAADIIKLAMLKVYNALKGMKSKLILQIHDELIIDTDPSELETVKTIIKTEMENAYTLSVPLIAEVGCGETLEKCK